MGESRRGTVCDGRPSKDGRTLEPTETERERLSSCLQQADYTNGETIVDNWNVIRSLDGHLKCALHSDHPSFHVQIKRHSINMRSTV